MTDQNRSSAVATATDAPPEMTTEVINIAGRGEVERLTARMTIPADYQYAISKWAVDHTKPRKPDGTPEFVEEVQRIGLTVDAYDYMNRVLGVSFFFPDTVNDEKGNRVPNPIWVPPDYTLVLMGATWVTPMGQSAVAFELVSVDFWRIYQDKRANSKSASLMESPSGEDIGPTFDKRGDMNLVLSPAEEMKAYQELTRQRALGPRYAQTVGRVRLLKMASGIRSLPGKVVKPYPLVLTGYRDQMDARERVQNAVKTSTETSLYGRPADETDRVSAQEMAEAGVAEDHDAEPLTPNPADPSRTFTAEELRDAGID